MSIDVPAFLAEVPGDDGEMYSLPFPIEITWLQCSPHCLGWLHMVDPREVQACDECARFTSEEEALKAHALECGCDWGREHVQPSGPHCNDCDPDNAVDIIRRDLLPMRPEALARAVENLPKQAAATIHRAYATHLYLRAAMCKLAMEMQGTRRSMVRGNGGER